MISYKEALALIANEAATLPTQLAMQTVGRDAALGKIAAKNIVARLVIPPFDNASMDGFAIRAHDTAQASIDSPLRIKVAQCLAAGDIPSETVAQGAAVEIMTGAKMPASLDAVVPIEKVTVSRDGAGQSVEIALSSKLQTGENVRYAGEDFSFGQTLVTQGTRLHAGHIAAMAANGIEKVAVFRMPAIEIFSTGKEVSDAYDSPLKEGEIYNSNAPYLMAQLRSSGIDAHYSGNTLDDEAAFVAKINSAQEIAASPPKTTSAKADIVISSGAVSMGQWDFVPRLLKANGARIIFHGVAIKPGKPVLFARLSDGRFYFGLPGNPISAAVGLRFFVLPLIRHLLSMPPEQFHLAQLAHSFQKKNPLAHFLKARLDNNADNQTRLSILDGQESFKIAPLLSMNCWALINEQQNDLGSNSLVACAPMELL